MRSELATIALMARRDSGKEARACEEETGIYCLRGGHHHPFTRVPGWVLTPVASSLSTTTTSIMNPERLRVETT